MVLKLAAYLISHSDHLTHLQVLHGRTQVSDRTESQTAVTLVGKAMDSISVTVTTAAHGKIKKCICPPQYLR